MPLQVNAQIQIENEQLMVKRQIEGSNDDKILRIRYPRKYDETKNPMKIKSNDLDLSSWRNPCLKTDNNLRSNLGEKMKIPISKMKLPI